MASRLYPTTQRLFLLVVAALRSLGMEAAFASPTAFALAALYLSGLILLEGRQTPWRMAAWLPARCHDALSRLLREMPVPTRPLLRALCAWAARQGTGYLCLDEVVIEKPFSKMLPWCGWVYSFAKRRKVYGLHVVVLVSCVGRYRIPVNFRLWRPRAACRPSPKRRKGGKGHAGRTAHKAGYRTKLQLAEEMLLEVRAWGLAFEYLVFDGHYTAGWLTKKLSRWDVQWVGLLDPQTRVVHGGKRLPIRELAPAKKKKWRKSLGLRARALSVYAPTFGHLRVVAFRNKAGQEGFIATNVPDARAADLTALVGWKRSRWSIETAFRDAKQFGGLEACQCRAECAWVRHVAFAFVGFVVLQLLRRSPEETLGAAKERLQLEALRGRLNPPAPLRAHGALV